MGLGYVVFQISNTLFLSKSDLKGAFGLVVFLTLLFGLLYLLGIHPSAEFFSQLVLQHQAILTQAVRVFWLPILIDAVGITVLWLARDIFK